MRSKVTREHAKAPQTTTSIVVACFVLGGGGANDDRVETKFRREARARSVARRSIFNQSRISKATNLPSLVVAIPVVVCSIL